MIYVHISAVFALLLFLFAYTKLHSVQSGSHVVISHDTFFYVMLVAFLIRIAFALISKGFGSDTACFASWADRIFQVGPAEFYSSDVFTDYPPGFMYILYIIGAIRTLLGIPYYSALHLLLLKLPAIFCDLFGGYLLYRVAVKKCSESQAQLISLVYLLNPAVILNSSIWGQVDSVFTLLLLMMCLFLIEEKLFPAYIVFGIGILLKPQMLMFAPVLLAGILDFVFLKDFSLKKFCKNLLQGVGVILCMVLLCLPFGLEKVLPQYLDTLNSYPYAAVNAYNFWGFFGLNWISQDTTFLSLSFHTWGMLVIFLVVILTFVLSLRNRKDTSKYPILGAFVIITMFVFSVRMHDRYLYPAMILLLLAFLYRPEKELFFCYGAFSILHLYNTAHVLFFYDPQNYDRKAPVIILVSAGTVCMAIYFYRLLVLHYSDKKDAAVWDIPVVLSKRKSGRTTAQNAGLTTSIGSLLRPTPGTPEHSATKNPLKKTDWILMLTVMAVYSAFALYDLGDRQAPATSYTLEAGNSMRFTFDEGQKPASLSYYIGPWQERIYTVEYLDASSGTWLTGEELTLKSVFTWQNTAFSYPGNEVRLTLTENGDAILFELVFLDENGAEILPSNAADYPALFDESSLRPERSTFRNSMYFDEIYHGRTAYEFLHGLTTYENTHPPLGKILISIGVAIFGMNPFGWRIIGTLFGIAMVPFLYLFAKKLTGNTPLAALACVLFSFDFMHFTQTRLATIDVYITFFVILMYYFMYVYSHMSFYDTSLYKTFLPLGACGICMGLGIACKWTGIYAGLGLALIFFGVLYRRYREYLYARQSATGSTAGIAHKDILRNFFPYTKKTILFCLVFFVAIPVLIYLLSYIPFVDGWRPGFLAKILHNQESMFSYHSTLESTHPYSSTWYEWSTMIRPIWYYSGTVSDTLREGISAFGNPLVWWVGIPAFLYQLYLTFRKKDRTAAFLVIGYLAQYLPWFFVTRITFIYHYFPSVAFVVLMIIYSLMQLGIHSFHVTKASSGTRSFLLLILLYGLAAFGLFLLFYPVLSGEPVEAAFVDKYLRWLNTWVLTSR